MPDTLARRHLGPDSGDDFASASEGEEYENMEVSRPVAARPSSAASRGPLTANKYDNGSLSLQQPTGMARTHIPVPLPDQHDDLSPRFGNKSFLSSRPVTDKGQASRAPSYPLHESHAEAPDHGRFQDTNTFSESAASGPNTTVDAKESGRAWGSLSSWINTAVSTVSEVIENPNVVVTKAHNIGQGIRNVATEQIDRVYESLDPEYEYERERLSKQRVQQQSQQSQQAKQHQQQSSADLPWPQFRPPLPPQQTPSSLDKGDLSDLLESSRLQSELRPPSPKLDSSSQLQSLNSTSRLGVPAGNLVDRDGWADDAWGDDWDNEVDLTELTMDTTKKVQPTVESAQSSLAVPLSHEDESRSDKPSSRRSSADLGPAEALFSTLDFASNALGSAVLGVHRKVTQSSQSATLKRGTIDDATHPRTVSPTWINTQRPSSTEGRTRQEATERSDKPTITNPSLEVVGGNVVSTGLGALEILGKKAVDVISDVRRAGHLNHAQGGSISSMDHLEDTGPFKVPSRMNLATLFDDAGGRAHLIAMRSLASTAASRVAPWMSTRQDLLEMGQLYELEQQLQPPSLDSAVKDLPTDLLAGHKDFRAMVTLLEKMGFQGTAHLRQLRNCTRRLTSLVPDSVNAFEQEWHNHQSRASERDFFAKAPIKKFFESRLMLIYFDGLRALSQFTNKTCDQALKLAENIDIHLAEKTGSIGRPNASLDTHEHERPSPSKIAPLLRQFLGNLIAEIRFIARIYSATMEAVLEAAKRFITPLDRLDWEDLAMGVDKIRDLLTAAELQEAVGLVHLAAACIGDTLKNELLLDAIQGRLVPAARSQRPQKSAVTAELSPTTRHTQTRADKINTPNLTSSMPALSPQQNSVQSLSSVPKLGSHTRQTITSIRPTAPNAGVAQQTAPSNESALSLPAPGQRPSSASSQRSCGSTRLPPVQPKLKDDDFFSILDD